ncbi:MAG TPA: YibE/F family protein [Anaerolineales bacterium]|nr:YibE/F family protein [Anaerolineales bacterium]
MKILRAALPLAIAVIVTLAIGSALTRQAPTEPPSTGLSRARVIEILEQGTADLGDRLQPYQIFQIEIEEGPYAGSRFVVEHGRRQVTIGDADVRPGEQVLVAISAAPDGRVEAFFADFVRIGPLAALLLLFVAAILIVSRGKGLRALVGILISLAIIGGFILPAILAGGDPVLVSILGGFVLMASTFYLIHGWTLKAHTAALATLAAMALTGVLAAVSVNAARLTGMGSEEALFLTQFAGAEIDVRGLLLASILVGALGVLDDLTINQISAVFELRQAKPDLPSRSLYRRAMVIGQDHIAATVNTLVLAYVGASLPLLLLFNLFQEPLLAALNRAAIAEEILRTLVGSIGLVAAVPIATALAAAVQRYRGHLPGWLGPEMLDVDRG